MLCRLAILLFCLTAHSSALKASMSSLRIGRRNETMEEFIEKLFEDYNNNIPPSMYTGKCTLVKVGIYVHAISGVNERSMDYSVNMFLRQYWSDERLQYHNDYNESLTLNYMKSKLWVPDLYFINEKEGNFHMITTPNLLLRLNPRGGITFSQKVTVKLSCPMKLKKFPMDKQVCVMKMESYGYTTNELKFEWIEDKKNAVQFSKDLELPEFDAPKKKTGNCTLEYLTGAYSCLIAEFHLTRKFGFYLIQTYIPSILIVILSWVSFWIDVQAVPARISLGLLTVLSMTTQSSGVRGQLPRVSYIKAIDVWMSTCLVFVFGALIEYAIANVLARTHSSLQRWEDLRGYVTENSSRPVIPPVPRIDPNNVTGMRPTSEDGIGVGVGAANSLLNENIVVCNPVDSVRQRNKDVYLPKVSLSQEYVNLPRMEASHAEMIDRISRMGFPISFALFNLGYWLYYLYLI